MGIIREIRLLSGMETVTTESVLTRWGVWQAAANLSQCTINGRTAVVRQILAFSQCGPYELTAEDIVLFISRPGLQNSTRATYHSAIQAYCLWLVKTRRRADNPADETPAPKRRKGIPRPVKESDLDKIIAAANRRRTKMMVYLATLAGLRVHEVAKFSGSDIDWENMSMIVAGKGGKTAYLPVHPLIAAEASNFPKQGVWFPAYTHDGPIDAQSVSKAIKSTMKRAGVQGTPHQLRHYYATAMLRSGANLRVVQQLMRHESVATTQIYTEVTSDEMRAAVNTLLPTPTVAA